MPHHAKCDAPPFPAPLSSPTDITALRAAALAPLLTRTLISRATAPVPSSPVSTLWRGGDGSPHRPQPRFVPAPPVLPAARPCLTALAQADPLIGPPIGNAAATGTVGVTYEVA